MKFAATLSGQTIDQLVQQVRTLRASGNWQDSETLLAAAVAIWPNEETVLLHWASIAHAQMHWSDMAERFALVRSRCPGQVMGHSRGGEALRWLKRFEEAEALISAAVPRFPDNVELLVQWVLAACDRSVWGEAEVRAETLLARQPDSAESYRFAAEVYIRQGRHSEGDVLLGEGLHRLGPVPGLVLRFAEVASLRQDWPRAARRWAAARRHLPELPTTHRSLATVLANLGHLIEAEQVLSEAMTRFPDQKGLAIDRAWMATKRQAWDEARWRWEILRDRFPQDTEIEAGLLHLAARSELEITSPAVVSLSGSHLADRHEIMAAPKRLLWQFESVGENCEFGLVQRHFGIEPISLMRWSATSYAQLLQAIETDFEGVGELANTELHLNEYREYLVRDRRVGLNMHTFVKEAQVEGGSFLDTQVKRLRFLVRKFREEAELAERILVRATPHPITAEQICQLHRALRRYGPVTLLHVGETADAHKVGTVEWLDRDLMIGFIARRSHESWRIPYDVWLSICRSAFALRTGPTQAD